MNERFKVGYPNKENKGRQIHGKNSLRMINKGSFELPNKILIEASSVS